MGNKMDNSASSSSYISERIPVPAGWEDALDPFYFAANKSATAIRKSLLPNFQSLLVFILGTPVRIFPQGNPFPVEKTMVIGPLKQILEYEMPPGSEMLVVNFKYDTFYRFFGTTLTAYNNYLQNPDELIKDHCFAALWFEIKQLATNEQRIARILDFGDSYLRDRDAASVDIIRNGIDETILNPVKKIASNNGQSERNVQLNYKKYFGYSAKEINRYQRFRKSLLYVQQSLGQGKVIDWFDIIDYGGYFDQSHFIRDFKHYLGITPNQFLKLQQDMCIAGG